ncbi:MAG: membrane protein insertion efficiency factor YidD [bacterium]|nr:membrane protein insertion efficiency factor YidD [bacterium]
MVPKILLRLIKIYQNHISPFFPPTCRFSPSCSRYFEGSIRKYGLKKGVWKGLIRILKCNPLHPGGYDPVEREN